MEPEQRAFTEPINDFESALLLDLRNLSFDDLTPQWFPRRIGAVPDFDNRLFFANDTVGIGCRDLRVVRIGSRQRIPTLLGLLLPQRNAGIRVIARALETGRDLAWPTLWRGNLLLPQRVIGDAGIRVVARALESGRVLALRRLWCSSTSIGVEEAIAIAKALQSPSLSSLIALDLSNNPTIKEEGRRALLVALKSGNMSNLQDLFLDNMRFTEEDMLEIAALLKSGNLPALMALSLRNNVVSERADHKFLDAYHENMSVVADIYMHPPPSPDRFPRSHRFKFRNEAKFLRNANIFIMALRLGLLPGLKQLTLGSTGQQNVTANLDELFMAWRSKQAIPLEDLVLPDYAIRVTTLLHIAILLESGNLPQLRLLHVISNSISERVCSYSREPRKAGREDQFDHAFRSNDFLAVRGERQFDDGCSQGSVAREFANAFRENKSLVVKFIMPCSHVEIWRNRNIVLCRLAPALESGAFTGLKRLSITTSPQYELDRPASDIDELRKGVFCNVTSDVDELVGALESEGISVVNELKLTQFVLEDKGLTAISRALECGHVVALEELCLAENSMGDEGAMALAKALQSPHLSSLTKLDLSGNPKIGDVGRLTLLTALKSGTATCLQELHLQGSSLGEQDMVATASMLEAGHLPRLEKLDLSGYEVTQNSAKSFVKAYQNNKCLVVDINVRWPTWFTRSNAEGLRARNLRLVGALNVLQNEEDESGSHGKVFLCGHPNVGKTTLRRSLMRSKLKDLVTNKRRPWRDDRTRGIEVSHLVSKNWQEKRPLMLALWDLAGQSEYHILHSAFLPDLAFADGRATIFVVVCSANGSKSSTFQSAVDELSYWMKFISSSSVKDVTELKRQVFVVLNCFEGDRLRHLRHEWTAQLRDCHKKFASYLDIHEEPFIVDARYAGEVQGLKQTLISKAKQLLRDRPMPLICRQVQDNCKAWADKNAVYPVLQWQQYSSRLFNDSISQDRLIAATEYLHEAGHVIYLREGALTEGGLPDESFVILDPEWLCQRVIGDLLLPTHMLRPGESHLRSRMEPDGSLPIDALKQHFPEQLCGDPQVKEVVAIFLRLGLAYKTGDGKLHVPALIEKNDAPEWWRSKITGQCVMGFSLVLEDAQTTLLPISLLGRLQVRLAQDPNIGKRTDSEYFAGQSLITFKLNGMAVLVEFSAGCRDSKHDRVDILVKPLANKDVNKFLTRERQVNLAKAIMEIIESTCLKCCPGVELVERVVRPWETELGLLPVEERDVRASVAVVKERVIKNGIGNPMNWTLRGELVKQDELLAQSDLQEVKILLESQCSLIEEAVVVFDLSPDTVLGINSPSVVDASKIRKPELDDSTSEIIQQLDKCMSKRFNKMNERFDELMSMTKEVRGNLQKLLVHQKEIVHKVHALEQFAIKEKESSVPRFIYFAPTNNPSLWMTLKQAFAEVSKLHFLCEAQYNDRSLHEVEGQEGVEISKLKWWAEKLAPILDWSLRVAVVASKIAGTAILPGLGLLVPEMRGGALHNSEKLAHVLTEVTNYTSSYFSEQQRLDLESKSLVQGNNNATTSTHIGHGEGARAEGRAALKVFLGKLSPLEFMKQVGLSRVVLLETDPLGSPADVVWICNECASKYGKLAKEI